MAPITPPREWFNPLIGIAVLAALFLLATVVAVVGIFSIDVLYFSFN